ncbi:MAG: carbohydrate ABC transporter permease [Candidatus Limnocylindrales bacterium]
MFLFSTRRIKLLLLLPALVIFCVYVLYPIGYSLLLAFQYKPTYRPGHFIGIDNFVEMLSDDRFWTALKNTAIIAVVEILLIPALAFLLGLLINQSFRGSSIVKVLAFTPYILAGIVTTLIWVFIVDPNIGLINGVLNAMGVDTTNLLLIGGRDLTPVTVGVIESWKSIGFFAVLFMAGLKMIPQELFDAAAVDGATALQRVRFITLPMLRETNKIVIVLVFLNAVQSLQTVFILTGGGPNYESHSIGSYIYNVFITQRRVGYASSITLFMFVVMMVFSVAFLMRTSRRVEE